MLNSKKLAVFISVAFVCAANSAVAIETTGPSSSATPYLVAGASGVGIASLITVGDTVNNKPDGTPYRMVGLPDGLGAFDNDDGTFTVLMNHELRNTDSSRFSLVHSRARNGVVIAPRMWRHIL